jgi:hypothetical protein
MDLIQYYAFYSIYRLQRGSSGEIAKREDNDFEPGAYAAWANAIFDSLKSKMEVN